MGEFRGTQYRWDGQPPAFAAKAAERKARTKCPKGHVYDEENTYEAPDGSRKCRKCMALATKKWKGKK